MAIKSLAQTLKDLATGIKNAITGVTGSNATLTITKGNGMTSTVTVNNVANATNATKATQDSAGQQINTTYIKGLSISNNALIYTKGNDTTGNVDLIPAGIIHMFAGNTIPAGWLLCDGSAVSRTDYAKLFSAIGTTWGAGDGSTTFNLPNTIGRFAEGAATSGSYKSAGLPNIVGTFLGYDQDRNSAASWTGAFKATQYCGSQPAGSSSIYDNEMFTNFNAAWSNSIYGNSSTVQPNSYTVRKIIKY